MVILSVDYGDARTGIAVCDRMGMLASPVTVINQSYEPKLIAEINELVKKHRAEKIVVGLPKNMDGTEGERAHKCKAFAKKLQQETGVEAVMWDERLTTVSAHRALNVTNVTGKKRKGIVDAVSAVMILEDYLAAYR
ncbi:MAG: Holliday junction resolvase RuvX [Ruminococcaceae bacterium]|nr:Holliday junction resolvase RuvX [Oscillospiraceae bacterium]